MFQYTGNIEVFLMMLVAVALGGVIGLEREFHGSPAGLRTHILVCLGAAIIMGSSRIFEESFILRGAQSVFRIDPGRIAAGVVTGIGFLGAGAIVRSHDFVRGLTTAACIWYVAATGIVVGCGLYLPAVIVTVLGLLVLMGLNPIGHHIPKVEYGKITITSNMADGDDIETLCRQILGGCSVIIDSTGISANAETARITLTMWVHSRKLKDKSDVLKKLLSLPDILDIAWQ